MPPFVVSEIEIPVSATALREILLKGLSASAERSDPIYLERGFSAHGLRGQEIGVSALAEGRETARFGKQYFAGASNAGDLYVHFMGQPIVSAYYCANGKALDYRVTFWIGIEAVDQEKSKMTVRTIESAVFLGKSFNAHAMGFVPTAVKVPPSPLDEYKILAYAAHLAGVQLTPIPGRQATSECN